MKIVIDIPQGLKIDFENENWTALTCMEMKNALMKGTPLDKIRAEIDAQTEIHSDGEFYIKNIDVKRIINKYTKGEQE